MTSRRILLIDEPGPLRDGLARALAMAGLDVQVAGAAEAEGPGNEFTPDAVVYGESCRGIAESWEGVRRIALPRPVNMEELRRVMREDV